MLAKDILQSNMPLNWKQKELEKKMRYYCEPREERRMKDKFSIADNIIGRLRIKGTQKEEIYDFIKKYKLKELLTNCSQEETIACIVFHVLFTQNSMAKPSNYKVFNEYNVTERRMNVFYKNLYRLDRQNNTLKYNGNLLEQKNDY